MHTQTDVATDNSAVGCLDGITFFTLTHRRGNPQIIKLSMVSTGDLAEVESQLQPKSSLDYLDAVSDLKTTRDSAADIRKGMSETNIDAATAITFDNSLNTVGKPQRGQNSKKQKRGEMEAEEDMDTLGGSEDSLNNTIVPNVAVDLPAFNMLMALQTQHH